MRMAGGSRGPDGSEAGPPVDTVDVTGSAESSATHSSGGLEGSDTPGPARSCELGGRRLPSCSQRDGRGLSSDGSGDMEARPGGWGEAGLSPACAIGTWASGAHEGRRHLQG